MKFTSLFFENLFLFGKFSSVLPGAIVGIGSSSMLAGFGTVYYGMMSEDSDAQLSSLLSTTGILALKGGADFVCGGIDAYEKTLEQLDTTQAYVESLNLEELESLISKLEVKGAELSLENKDESYQKKKTNI